MKLIEKKDTFEEIRALAGEVIDLEAKLPDQVFRKEIQEFLFIDVDELFTEEFYKWMSDFVVSIKESSWYFLAEYSNPDHFFSDFGKYPVFEVCTGNSYEEYWNSVGEEPSEDTGQAIYHAGTIRIFLFSQSFKWCVLMDRDFELGIAGFSSADVADKFRMAFGNENIFNLNQAFDMFVSPGITSFMRFGGRTNLLKEFSVNYGE